MWSFGWCESRPRPGRRPGRGARALVAAGIAAVLAGAPAADEASREGVLEGERVAPTSGLAPCSARLEPVQLEVAASDEPDDAASVAAIRRLYGAERWFGVAENVRVREDAGPGSPVLRVSYPKGSASFSLSRRGRPLGGASFYAPFARAGEVSAVCLRYQVRFPRGFDFVRGGKLPGLYAGKAPSGGEEVTGRNGWSVRLMWREGGEGELYEYVVNKPGKHGLRVGKGAFRFETGRWISVDLELVPNEVGERDGRARLWIDGGAVIEQDGIVFRTAESRSEIGLMFSTFFGGNDESWATTKDEHVDFSGFRVFVAR